MIYSKSTEYAIRATVNLAQLPDGQCAMAKDVASEEGIPAPFLAKILQELARKGLLRSVKGPAGGFSLKKKAADIRLLDVVGAVDGLAQFSKCVVGFAECNSKTACPMHDSWMTLHSRIMEYLERNTIGSLVKSFEGKRKGATKKVKKTGESRKALQAVL